MALLTPKRPYVGTVMKRVAPMLVVWLLGAATTLSALGQDYTALAQRIVRTAQLKPGNTVLIFGGQHTVPLMEAVAIEAQKAGGRVNMMLSTDRVERSFWMDVPMEHLSQRPPVYDWLQDVDVYVGLPGVENSHAVYDDIPEDRFAKGMEANKGFAEELNASGLKGIFIGYPTEAAAAEHRVDFATIEKMHWDALSADYEAIARQASALSDMLRSAETVRITSPAGTDVTFKVDPSRPIFKADGSISDAEVASKSIFDRTEDLPGGSVFFAPVETSARGQVVIPEFTCRSERVRNASFSFQEGTMRDFKADQGADCLSGSLAPYEGPKDMFGSITIGLNPSLRIIEDGGADYRPTSAAGMVYLGIGGNEFYGGNNQNTGGYTFPITNATVEIDGTAVVKDGNIVL